MALTTRLCAAIGVFVAVGCGGSTPPRPSDYVPLEAGTMWSYDITVPPKKQPRRGFTLHQDVGGDRIMNSHGRNPYPPVQNISDKEQTFILEYRVKGPASAESAKGWPLKEFRNLTEVEVVTDELKVFVGHKKVFLGFRGKDEFTEKKGDVSDAFEADQIVVFPPFTRETEFDAYAFRPILTGTSEPVLYTEEAREQIQRLKPEASTTGPKGDDSITLLRVVGAQPRLGSGFKETMIFEKGKGLVSLEQTDDEGQTTMKWSLVSFGHDVKSRKAIQTSKKGSVATPNAWDERIGDKTVAIRISAGNVPGVDEPMLFLEVWKDTDNEVTLEKLEVSGKTIRGSPYTRSRAIEGNPKLTRATPQLFLLKDIRQSLLMWRSGSTLKVKLTTGPRAALHEFTVALPNTLTIRPGVDPKAGKAKLFP
jgi:hypothetical protein